MAIIFHEGLPRSGKSYEAMSRHIARALKAARPVDAYIEGIDHHKIAAAVDLPLERVQELLRAFTREQVPTMHREVRNNALVVIDEAQNFWPTGRQKLDAATTQFITEHGHRGIDILLMGQVLTDVHKLWRGRVRIKVVFNKLDTVGMERRYNAQTWQATAPEKFTKIGDETGTYDERWFGTYASHVDQSIQTGNYKDERASVWRHPVFRLWLPVAAVAAVAAVFVLVDYFNPEAAPQSKKPAQAGREAPQQPQARANAAPARRTLVDELMAAYRPRLGGYFEHLGREYGTVEWWDGDELRERLTIEQLRTLGAVVLPVNGMLRVNDRWVTPWPAPSRTAATPSTVALPSLSTSTP